MIEGVFGDTLLITMARVGVDSEGRPCLLFGMKDGSPVVDVPTPADIEFVARYALALHGKATALDGWVEAARKLPQPAVAKPKREKAKGRKRT